MQIFTTRESFEGWRAAQGHSVGFVPTMGALHEGHKSLIERAKAENDAVVVSIFVNPTQFLPGEDFAAYPRREEADRMICQLLGVDALWMPEAGELYGADEPMVRAPSHAGYVFEGLQRPGHFDGVLTVVLKLLMLVRPARAYFGRKDAQQLVLVRQMVERFFLGVTIVDCPTVRTREGLALSSRNAYLSPEGEESALGLSNALQEAAVRIGEGERCADLVRAVMREHLSGMVVDYAEVSDHALHPVAQIEVGNTLLLGCVRVEGVRLLDNLWL